jgi:Response regulator containing CheY-like receiver, AAA-type ATPase, and DNA-binding domains
MEHTFRPLGGGANPWQYSIDQDNLARPTVLLVEDDRDIREMVCTLLSMAGIAVVSCGTAECGLNALREQEFDLVLTDYALPRQSGLWLLREAESEGLIQGTPVLIVTAHPHVDAGDDYEVIQKPFDLDELIERVRQRMEGTGTPRRRRLSMPPSMPGEDGAAGGGSDCPDPVELILYVSSKSPRSFAAVRNIKKVLERFNSSRVKLTVCDLSQDPDGGIEDAVAFTPTLVRRKPGPRTFILGHITSPELLLELLADCDPDLN